MSLDASASLILDRAKVQDTTSVFVLGCYSKRVTFHSQQQRALNLIWALFHKGKLHEASKVAIIGAGLAGITAAVAAKTKGCDVTLYERSEDIMHIQRGNFTRYIHPNIYDWPREGCQENQTDLPFLNWCSGVTDQVVNQIEQEWDVLKQRIDLRFGQSVNAISEEGNLARVSVVDPFSDDAFDCVIVAAGFGLESSIAYIPKHSYWDSDSLHQQVNSGTSQREILLSGCGDGGLIDFLRLSIRDFRHESFTNEFLNDESLKDVKDKLIEIEGRIPSIMTDKSRFINDEYKSLNIPPEILKKLKRRVRNDTKVKLVGNSLTPFLPNASILNRFAVFLLSKIGKVHYEPGEVISAEANGNNYTIHLKKNDTNTVKKDFDQVILRHGPNPVVNNLVSRSGVGNDYDHETAKRLWEDGFYPARRIHDLSPQQKAEGLMKSLEERLKKTRNLIHTGVFISGTLLDPMFLVTYTGELNRNLRKMEDWQGYPIAFKKMRAFAQSSSGAIRFKIGRKAKPSGTLAVGAMIFNDDKKRSFGTLGCFVSLPNGMTGFLSTNHVLMGQHRFNGKNDDSETDKKIMAIDQMNGVHYEIGSVYRFVPMTYFNGKSISVNVMDAAIAKLNSGVAFSPFFTVYGEVLNVTEAAEPLPDISVYKMGAASGLTQGRIVGVSGRFTMLEKDRKLVFNDVFLVEGLSTEDFSSVGDSGAMVFDKKGNAYGIIVASSGGMTIVCPIKPILESLECRLYASGM
ncbi:FAD-dependent oxidoreductase [Pedobacter gandavensis]|uniref:FAD-dependent oxidoreductase n=1 Tax=Pedobacter gandavensis TaxID=2679963 RepID=UPI0024794972|nr:FAD-dependent oxidoreductase [Pedobacter gandavensis]WGQ08950.1 FAD-dependent oxidoreductase [Pedobacter gandavensis]